jgi:hypothetical protein
MMSYLWVNILLFQNYIHGRSGGTLEKYYIHDRLCIISQNYSVSDLVMQHKLNLF